MAGITTIPASGCLSVLFGSAMTTSNTNMTILTSDELFLLGTHRGLGRLRRNRYE